MTGSGYPARSVFSLRVCSGQQMKITMIRNAARHYGCDLKEGETGEVDDKLAESLISAGVAVAVATPSKKKIEAVPEKPAIKGE